MNYEQLITLAEAHIRIVDRWFEVDKLMKRKTDGKIMGHGDNR
jgi:hypothetical protein